MNDISKLNEANIYRGDIYVADYTDMWQKAHKAGKTEPENKGVVIQETAFEDIQYFYLQNNRQVEYIGVNLEKNKGLFSCGQNDCECLFKSTKFKKKGWLLLLELKYCMDEERNLTDNLNKAYKQVTHTHETLTNKGYIDPAQVRTYCNIAAPTSMSAPFNSFLTNQDEKLNYLKENHIILLGYNEVLILNEGYIQVPKVAI